jgi:hypothetical protein
MSKGNTQAQEMISNISAESILIPVESNWIQVRLRVKRAKGGTDVKGVIQSPKTEAPNTPAFRLPHPFRLYGFLTQARQNRIISLKGACDGGPKLREELLQRIARLPEEEQQQVLASCWRELR